MAAGNTSSQNTNTTGGTSSNVGEVALRDLNSSIGGFDLSNFGAATSSATSGAVTTGDRILGGNQGKRQFGIVKMLALFAGAAILIKLYKESRK